MGESLNTNGSFRPIAVIRTTMNNAGMSSLRKAIGAVRDGTSLYWAFYRPEDAQAEAEAEAEVVEVRLNATPQSVGSFTPSSGWVVDRVQWGDTLFLRREQSLERNAVEEMLVEALQLANANGMTLHSWLHGPDVD